MSGFKKMASHLDSIMLAIFDADAANSSIRLIYAVARPSQYEENVLP